MKKADHPLLSICIPTYNRAELLRETLEYLADTIDPSYEIVVSNNTSTDHTAEVLKDFKAKWKNFRYIQQTRLLTSTENFGAALWAATGKYSYSFCDDDRLIPEGLNAAIQLMEDNPEVIGVFGGYQECEPETEKVLCTLSPTDKLQIFPKGAKIEIFNGCRHILFSPVMRNEQCRRFCISTYDKFSAGYWPFVSKMLDHDSVAIIPDPIYKHLQVEPRGEFTLTEGYTHDKNLALFEIFFGELGPCDHDPVITINKKVTAAYVQGIRFAIIKKEWLTVRNYILRSRAYGLLSDEVFRSWEAQYIQNMASERIIELISVVPGVEKILIESSEFTEPIIPLLSENLPEIEIIQVDTIQLTERKTADNEYIIAWDYETLRNRAVNLENDPLRQSALKDIYESTMTMHSNLS